MRGASLGQSAASLVIAITTQLVTTSVESALVHQGGLEPSVTSLVPLANMGQNVPTIARAKMVALATTLMELAHAPKVTRVKGQ